MPDTLQNVKIPANRWVDLYAETGITVGAPISVQNVGTADVYLTVAADEPPVDYEAYNIVMRDNGIRLRNSAGDSGAWAFVPAEGGEINVRELTA